jgi:hypothetical protein
MKKGPGNEDLLWWLTALLGDWRNEMLATGEARVHVLPGIPMRKFSREPVLA